MKSEKLKKLIAALAIIALALIVIIVSANIITHFKNNDKVEQIYYRPPATATVFMSEEGTESNPYVIKNATDMYELSTRVANGNTYAGKVIVVDSSVNEINLGDFTPIGTSSNQFSGTFDGYGTNFILQIDKNQTDNVGLFCYVFNGIVENLSVSGKVTGKNNVAGIVGYLDGEQLEAFIQTHLLKEIQVLLV